MKLIVFLLTLIATSSYGTNYYVSGNGSDTNPGTKELPWRSISKINASKTSFNPGDSILFERGGVYYGQLEAGKSGTASAYIVYSAYGTGANPILSGVVELGKDVLNQSSVWTQVSGTGIWRCYYKTGTNRLTQLFVNGKRKFISRYPNKGFLFVDEKGTDKTFVDAEIGKDGSYFTGSRVAIRIIADKWTNQDVASVSGSLVTLNASAGNDVPANCGYYFFGSYKLIDVADEWYFKDAVDSMYYMPPSGVDPNTLKIEASYYNYCIDTKLFDYLVFTSLTIERAAADGINFAGSQYSDFKALTIRECYHRAIMANNYDASNPEYRSLYCNITDCLITDCQMGITTYRVSYGSISRNTFKRIGTQYKGYVAQYADAISTDLEGHHKLISYNKIDSMSKNGIRIGDSENTIERNIITNCGIATADVAGIYLGKSDKKCFGNLVRNNFVYNMRTDSESWKDLPDGYVNLNPGLYNDLYAKDNRWIKNTVFDGGMGILCQNEVNAIYRGNIIYNFYRTGMAFVERPNQIGESGGFAKDNQLYKNIFYKKIKQTTRIFSFENREVTSNNWGSFISKSDSNRFIYPYDKENIGSYAQNSYELITFSKWKAKFTNDKHSAVSFFTATDTEPDQSVLITNMSDASKTMDLNGTWYDLDGNVISEGKITVEPWYSAVIVKGSGATFGNVYPQVSITSPQAESVFESGANITISANATDTDGSVERVEFYYNDIKIGEDDTAPYTINWDNVPDGQYDIKVIAYDNSNAASTSQLVLILVGDGELVLNVTPMEAFTPNNDGLNDIWNIADIEAYQNISVVIYNDKGKKVYSADSDVSWDGSVKGDPAPAGAYYYTLSRLGGMVKKGSFILLR